MQTVAQELHEKTLAYWNMSQVWNGRIESSVATGEAIDVCTTILQITSYTRLLSFTTDRLLCEIIKGEGQAPRETSAPIVLMRAK